MGVLAMVAVGVERYGIAVSHETTFSFHCFSTPTHADADADVVLVVVGGCCAVRTLLWPTESMHDDTAAHRKHRQFVLDDCKRRLADDHLSSCLERLAAAEYAASEGRKVHNRAVTVAIGMNELFRDASTAGTIRSYVKDAVRTVFRFTSPDVLLIEKTRFRLEHRDHTYARAERCTRACMC